MWGSRTDIKVCLSVRSISLQTYMERKYRYEMIKVQINDFDLEKISKSGQCFRMNPIMEQEKKYALIAHGEYLEMEETTDGICFSCTQEEWDKLWKNYFDCGRDYRKIYWSVDKTDEYMLRAVSCGSGIRILRQEIFETTISFIISQQNNIPRIKKCVQSLCSSFGEEKYNIRREKYYAFPTPERLAGLTLEDLQGCNLGYRSRYILKSSRMIVEGEIDFAGLADMTYEEARAELMKLCGVGIKVAECICLFALHHVEAFPVDTHIKTVLLKYYPDGFPFEKYEGYAGILQQYAFYYDIYGEM